MKITLIGAGGVIFAQRFLKDIMLDPSLKNAEVCLMDISRERLENSFTLPGVDRGEQLYPQSSFAGLTLDPAKEYVELWNNKKVSGSELEKMVIHANHFLLIGVK